MPTQTLFKFLTCVSLLSLIIGCKKDEETPLALPEKTQIGANSFGCLLNGQIWINSGQVCSPLPEGCRKNPRGLFLLEGELVVNADRVTGAPGDTMKIESLDFFLNTYWRGEKSYSTASGDALSFRYNLEYGSTHVTYANIDSRSNFTIQLTKIDRINEIVSGEFSGVIYKLKQEPANVGNYPDSLIVKDGRFDIQLGL